MYTATHTTDYVQGRIQTYFTRSILSGRKSEAMGLPPHLILRAILKLFPQLLAIYAVIHALYKLQLSSYVYSYLPTRVTSRELE